MLRLIAAQSLIVALTLFFNPIMIATGKAKAFVVFLLTNALLTTGLVLVLLPFGMQAMLIGFIVHTLVLSVGMVLWISWGIGIPAGAFLRPCVAPGLASAVMAGAVAGVTHITGGLPAWASLIAQIATGVVIYGAALIVIDKPTLMHLLKSAKMLVPKPAAST
jgi:O-antigen/teichoic acid export membrane protein